MTVPRLFFCDLSLYCLLFGLFLCKFLFEFFCFKNRGWWLVSVFCALGFRCEIIEIYESGTGSCKRSFIPVSEQGAHLKMIISLGQRPIIIVPIDSHCFAPKQDSFICFTTYSGPQHIQQTRERPRPCTSAAKKIGC